MPVLALFELVAVGVLACFDVADEDVFVFLVEVTVFFDLAVAGVLTFFELAVDVMAFFKLAIVGVPDFLELVTVLVVALAWVVAFALVLDLTVELALGFLELVVAAVVEAVGFFFIVPAVFLGFKTALFA